MSRKTTGLVVVLAVLAVGAAIALPIIRNATAPQMLDQEAAAALANKDRLKQIPQEELDKLSKVIVHAPEMECVQCFLAVRETLDLVEAVDVRQDDSNRDVHFYTNRSEQEVIDMLEEASKTNPMFAGSELKKFESPRSTNQGEKKIENDAG